MQHVNIPSLLDCMITGNKADIGGGIIFEGLQPTIDSNTKITGNQAVLYGNDNL